MPAMTPEEWDRLALEAALRAPLPRSPDRLDPDAMAYFARAAASFGSQLALLLLGPRPAAPAADPASLTLPSDRGPRRG